MAICRHHNTDNRSHNYSCFVEMTSMFSEQTLRHFENEQNVP